MNQIPVVVISLPNATERRATIAAHLSRLGIDFSFFDAVDGKRLSDQERDALTPPERLVFDRPLTPGEIGCAASHLGAIRQIAAGPDDFVCVIEDDAELKPAFVRFLDRALWDKTEFDVLRLISDPHRLRFPAWEVARCESHGLFAMARPGWGTQGQVWSRTGAQKVSRALPFVTAPIDLMLYHDCHVRGLRVLETRPGVIEHDRQFEDVSLVRLSVIGARDQDKASLSKRQRLRRRLIRWRRKMKAISGFYAAWGARAVITAVLIRPNGAFR